MNCMMKDIFSKKINTTIKGLFSMDKNESFFSLSVARYNTI